MNDLALVWLRYIRWLITPDDRTICPEIEIVQSHMQYLRAKQG